MLLFIVRTYFYLFIDDLKTDILNEYFWYILEQNILIFNQCNLKTVLKKWNKLFIELFIDDLKTDILNEYFWYILEQNILIFNQCNLKTVLKKWNKLFIE